ncbi:MAG: hypothetical protein ACE5E5_06005 [Phycisphaerae bacterium]
MSLVVMALGGEPQQKPDILPETPPDWRFERIDFPLSFAPDLKYSGFEELRFAPGMFNAKSDTYFTYLFAVKITNRVSIDAAMLKSFLETYYRGLCKTVAEGTEFAIDVAKITAVVEEDHFEAPNARHFHATLNSYDPFVTGRPLKLHLEMILFETGPTDHRICAAVSPKPTDSPVWKLLRSLLGQFLSRTLKSES